ncbi:ABC transporter ATP-binding protein [Kitasatospora sp. NPDC085879]|uniref:ABC transporter ATP-binding protein n=1 Tax=Kitasatospora sp. NPDC085879 TaxID=3154769 RepID=UPI003427AD65
MDTAPGDRPEPRPPVLDIRGLHHRAGERRLLRGIDLAVRPGESVAVVGPSGSGKSTLLACILGLAPADSGTVLVAGAEIGALGRRQLARHRSRHIGMVFQFGELLPELSPVDNVALAALLSGTGRTAAYTAAEALLSDLGVPTDGPTARLSGGERQRTAVARALVNAPALLLADEPTGSLDEESGAQVADRLLAVPARRGCGLLLVTHDLALAGRTDRVLRLADGLLRPDPVHGRAAGRSAGSTTA